MHQYQITSALGLVMCETSIPIPSFLGQLKASHDLLWRDYLDIARFTDQSWMINTSTASRTVRSARADWKVFAFLVHGKSPHEHMKEHGFLMPGMGSLEFERFSVLMEQLYFRRSRAMLSALSSAPENGIVSMWFSSLEPGAKIGLHINNDPYMYRAHIGLKVPAGDLGIKIGSEYLKWKEGELFAFDPTVPHTAWNFTKEPRVVFVVDFLRPDADRERMRSLEREQFRRMMEVNPLSFGMSGGCYDLDEDAIQRYAIPEIG